MLMREKLNNLLRAWPSGGIRTASILRKQGISSALAHKYTQSRWIESVGRGAYKLAGESPDWRGALYAVQEECCSRFHAGGLTSMEQLGYAHYLAESRPLFLYGPPKSKLPTWLTTSKFVERLVFTPTKLFVDAPPESLQTLSAGTFSVTISTLERAALELLYHVPQKIGFSEAQEIMDGLGTLRPALLQILLEQSGSVKINRLFLYFAREARHRWYAELDQKRFNLGAGNREVVKGGVLDKEFLLTLTKPSYPAEIPF
jgi:hypothetical protein